MFWKLGFFAVTLVQTHRNRYVQFLFMFRLNSGIKNRQNFFLWAIFLFSKIGNESVNHADSGDIQVFVQFPGNSFLEIPLRFWNCVGCVYMRGRFILKITQCVYLITLVILICEIGGTYLISHQPTQFQPP